MSGGKKQIDTVQVLSAEEAWQVKKPRYNGWQCGHGKHKNKKEAEEKAMELLRKVGLENKASAMPAMLSGGQQQRVAIARALAMEPQALLFDEPTSALDPELAGEVLAVMRMLAEEGMTMVVVTHAMDFARNVSRHTVFMENGYVVEAGDTESFFSSPRMERTREFLNMEER